MKNSRKCDEQVSFESPAEALTALSSKLSKVMFAVKRGRVSKWGEMIVPWKKRSLFYSMD